MLLELLNQSGERVADLAHFATARAAYETARREARRLAIQRGVILTAQFYKSRDHRAPQLLHGWTFAIAAHGRRKRESAPAHVLRNRHTRISKGMTRTAYRSGHCLDGAPASLSVNGTADRLAYGLQFKFRREACGACGCKCRGPFALNDAGRARLAKLRKAWALRELARLLDAGDVVECAACRGLSAYAWSDVEALAVLQLVAHVGACSGYEFTCGHCQASNVPQDSPLLAEVFTHRTPDEREDQD